jgi:hypothetical protein
MREAIMARSSSERVEDSGDCANARARNETDRAIRTTRIAHARNLLSMLLPSLEGIGKGSGLFDGVDGDE